MAGPIKILRGEAGCYRVLKHGEPVGEVLRSKPGELGHDPAMPWMLREASGRVDRFELFGDATDGAHKL